jgi:mRNA-degrading endonuclease RelE of RelBE toxin-antitoxin system
MELLFTPIALKRLKTIGPKDRQKAKRKIEAIKSDPMIGIPLKGALAGKRKLVAWPLRVIYSFNPQKQQVIIEAVEYRGRVYRKKR